MSRHVQPSGYQSQSRLSPAAMGGVLLVHVGLGAVLLTMSAVQILPPIDRILWTRNIPKEQPKPVAPPPQAVEKAKDRPLTSIRPEIPLPSLPDDRLITPTSGDKSATDPVAGPIADPLPPPEPRQPLLVQARPDPRFTGSFQPPYPAAMLRQQMEGAVTVRVTIGTDGRVVDVALVSAADPAFFEATRRQALARWRFLPATRDGIAVPVEKVMTVHFRLMD